MPQNVSTNVPLNIPLSIPLSIFEATLAETGLSTGEASTGEVRRIIAEGCATLLDSRKRAHFVAGHIPGALNVDATPEEAVAQVARLIGGGKDKPLVLYCNGPGCKASYRLAAQLVEARYTNVRRYQLGIPVWRALGGPTQIELEGIVRIFGVDRTAAFLDTRSAEAFRAGSLPGAVSAPAGQLEDGVLKEPPVALDDFNSKVVLFGDGASARAMAEALKSWPWHNVAYFAGDYAELKKAIG